MAFTQNCEVNYIQLTHKKKTRTLDEMKKH